LNAFVIAIIHTAVTTTLAAVFKKGMCVLTPDPISKTHAIIWIKTLPMTDSSRISSQNSPARINNPGSIIPEEPAKKKLRCMNGTNKNDP
jgi:hypothetical protein